MRWGGTTCRNCFGVSPPWGHVNSFDEAKLLQLFPQFSLRAKDFVSLNDERTNRLSCWLLDFAGNHWGSFNDEDRCLHCGSILDAPPPSNLAHRGCSPISKSLYRVQGLLVWQLPYCINT